ncbi:MAG: hypothetical protein HRU19_13160 [Pseudobacteriovorax sp.]|nr:hypothetical protein [Pseudobacteriovorax sp.]
MKLLSKLILIGSLLVSTHMYSATGSLNSRVISNSCNNDYSTELVMHASQGSSEFYSAWMGNDSFDIDESCEIRFFVDVPANRKIKLKQVLARGRVSVYSSGSSALYGISAETADGKNYTGTSKTYESSQRFSTGPSTYKRGNGSECGKDTVIKLNHHYAPLGGKDTTAIVDYYAFYVDLVAC